MCMMVEQRAVKVPKMNKFERKKREETVLPVYRPETVDYFFCFNRKERGHLIIIFDYIIINCCLYVTLFYKC